MAISIGQTYKCALCGNVVEVVFAGGGTLACCGEDMALLVENTVEASKEKHIPVVEKIEKGFKVSVGSIAHPMEDKHYIAYVELTANGVTYRKDLNPGDEPVVTFCVCAPEATAKAYCNLHGLWKA